MKKICLTLFFICCCWSVNAHTEKNPSSDKANLFFGKDDRVEVMAKDAWPWQAIGQIKSESGTICTAALITPNVVLTAGHCVLKPPGVLDKAISLDFVYQGQEQGWKYHLDHLETLVDRELAQALKYDDKGWIIPVDAVLWDYAFIKVNQDMPPLSPVPLWSGTAEELLDTLQSNDFLVTQAGYPKDHINELYNHQNCPITGILKKNILTHQCDTQDGDSGSPLLIKIKDNWVVIAVQSSAPPIELRNQSDNRALAVIGLSDRLRDTQDED